MPYTYNHLNELHDIKIRYKILKYYLSFLYKKHLNLELEIILSLFQHKQEDYHAFIKGSLSTDKIEPICNKISLYLKTENYPIEFIE